MTGMNDTTPARPDDGGDDTREHGSQTLPARFENPGLPAHVPRRADEDPKAARRAELQVNVLLGLSMLGTVAFVVSYLVIPEDSRGFVVGIGEMNLYHLALGLSMAISLLGIGFGVVHWAKTLMPDTEMVEERHPQRSDDEARDTAGAILATGLEESQLARRPMIFMTLGGALSLFGIPLGVMAVGGLSRAEFPTEELRRTAWDGGMRLVIDPSGEPLRASAITQGGVIHVMPEGYAQNDHEGVSAEELLHEQSRSSVIVVRLNPDQIRSQKQRDWGVDGIVAYSKVCTHVGCPVALYERTTHHLLCPCHQSTFDMTDDCKVIFGPAKRPLPQLPIEVDSEGYLIATGPFAEPVGPSFWDREL